MDKLRGLAALKQSDPERFAEIQRKGQQAAKLKDNGWTPERRAAWSKNMKELWKQKNELAPGQKLPRR